MKHWATLHNTMDASNFRQTECYDV